MSKDANESRWMDDYDAQLQPGLTCHIEIDNENGDTIRQVCAATAVALRAIAAQIEAGTLDDGSHPINTASGEKIGELYLDYHATVKTLACSHR